MTKRPDLPDLMGDPTVDDGWTLPLSSSGGRTHTPAYDFEAEDTIKDGFGPTPTPQWCHRCAEQVSDAGEPACPKCGYPLVRVVRRPDSPQPADTAQPTDPGGHLPGVHPKGDPEPQPLAGLGFGSSPDVAPPTAMTAPVAASPEPSADIPIVESLTAPLPMPVPAPAPAVEPAVEKAPARLARGTRKPPLAAPTETTDAELPGLTIGSGIAQPPSVRLVLGVAAGVVALLALLIAYAAS